MHTFCAIDCGFIDADGRAALRARSIVGLLPRMAEVWLRDPSRLRAGYEVCAAKSTRMVGIITLRITYIYMYI